MRKSGTGSPRLVTLLLPSYLGRILPYPGVSLRISSNLRIILLYLPGFGLRISDSYPGVSAVVEAFRSTSLRALFQMMLLSAEINAIVED